MSILSSIGAYVGRINHNRAYYRTERLIRSLPAEVQKDIGWPGIATGIETADDRRRANDSWPS
ncbi:MAG: hypothetical protein JJ913_00940 [Rhizobiaceae bacterium]|nr:hypothetical protein [Rhizobiaceae bacterium]